ncbi:Adenylate kinase [Hondaea fermentalgiana]|uniref:UMP-CMP kinase n=1 Tax=Hondaea fermentalgiana TaxID=2315210 RepID=A0A2R5GVA1_9STRA|nr:Adenylate kinase [Hondaea fermentalgiana]|eukprot:GBG34782.1 Adenylate kinase [Hondaea fermentalgiana]
MSGAEGEDSKVGFTRSEMDAENLAGKMEPPVVHVFAMFKEATAWGAKVEKMEGSPVGALQEAVKKLNPDQEGDFEICSTAAQAPGDGIEDGDLLIFPQRLRVPGGVSRAEEVIEAIMKQRKDKSDELVIADSEPVKEGFVFVCCHQARDARCGYCGPKIMAATEKAIASRNMADKVRLIACSHIGGHRYAGISVVFRNDAETTCDWLAYVKDSEEDANHMLDLATGVEETPALRLWRARNGMTPDQHIDFCAACAKKQGVDIEDAAGPSKVKKEKKKSKKEKLAELSEEDRNAEVGFARKDLENPEDLAGKQNGPDVHFFVAFKDAVSWGSHVEKMDGSPVTEFQSLIAELYPEGRKQELLTTAVEADGALEEGDVIVFPQRIRVPGGASRVRDIVEAVVKQKREGGDLALEGSKPVEGAHVFVCCHEARDARCGFCGPRIIDALHEARAERSIAEDKVTMHRCSHIGGHRNAGIGIVFRDDKDSTCDWLAYMTDSKENVNHVLDLATGAEETPDLAMWRARMGKTADEHKELCIACTQQEGGPSCGDGDIEDLMSASPKATATGKPNVLFVLGGPGAGKGTQCGLIIEEFADFAHLSAGDLLRAERQDPNSKNGQLISEYIKEGKIVPVEITVELLWNAMQKSEASNFLIDGFPRNQNNLDGWESVVGDKANVLGCLYFDCPENVMESRLLERGKTSGRSDDNLESIKKRFRTYVESTQPIIQHFDKLGKCIHIVADRPVHLVFADVRRSLRDGFGLEAAKPRVVFVLGGPGAGKGTQCELLTETFDLCHLSAGDLLREERNNPDSKDGALIKSYIKDGKIVPVEITVNLLLKAMLASGRGNFLIDGFPRNKNNLDGWASTVKDQADVLGCLYFDCPEEVMERRLLERGKTSGRSDDNLESIKKRFRTYQEETMPIIQHFQGQNKCFKINADRSKDVIRKEVNSVFEQRLGLRPLAAWTSSGAASSSGSSGVDSGVFAGVKARVNAMPPLAKFALGATSAALLVFAGTRFARRQ